MESLIAKLKARKLKIENLQVSEGDHKSNVLWALETDVVNIDDSDNRIHLLLQEERDGVDHSGVFLYDLKATQGDKEIYSDSAFEPNTDAAFKRFSDRILSIRRTDVDDVDALVPYLNPVKEVKHQAKNIRWRVDYASVLFGIKAMKKYYTEHSKEKIEQRKKEVGQKKEVATKRNILRKLTR